MICPFYPIEGLGRAGRLIHLFAILDGDNGVAISVDHQHRHMNFWKAFREIKARGKKPVRGKPPRIILGESADGGKCGLQDQPGG